MRTTARAHSRAAARVTPRFLVARRRYAIKSASDSWFLLWGYSKAEVVGQPIDVINGPGFDGSASAHALKHEGQAVRCRNTAKTGALYEHSLTIVRTVNGMLGHSTEIVPVARASARDAEVFGDDPLPPAPAPSSVKRTRSARDDEFDGLDTAP